MRVFKLSVMMFCLGVLVLLVPLTAKADEWNKETILTFNKPVEVPGMVLGPGSYDFKLLDSSSDRNIVEISSADGSHVYENVLAIPAYRLDTSDKTVVTFEERAKGAPDAIAMWFYPGDNSGEEFVYQNAKPVQTAKAIGPPAPSTPPVKQAQTATKPTPPAPPSPPSRQVANGPVTENNPVQLAQATTPPKPTVSSQAKAITPSKPEPKRLPKTASPVPLLILLGLLSLGASAGIHAFSKQC
jgi:hypothetical protein